MYLPHHFAVPDEQTTAMLHGIRAAELITPSADGLVATFLPLRYDESAGTLQGHFARANDHWRTVPTGDSLVIARGPDAYISPNWYATKREHGRVVPTWNYLTVHAHGPLIIRDDPDWLRDLVTRLTERQEADFERPWQVSDAPARFIDGQLRAIVGVELRITRLEAKAKLSQNRSVEDRVGVVAGLTESEPGAGVAELMRGSADDPDDSYIR